MSIIGKLKQFKDLREQGKKMQSAMAGESATANDNGVTITMDGNMQISGIAIDDNLLTPTKKEKLYNSIKNAHKDSMRKIQKIMAGKMQEMGGLEGLGLK
jgi:hypothetical protein